MLGLLIMRVWNNVWIVGLLCCLWACSTGANDGYILPEEPDYSEDVAWYKELSEANAVADIFYIAPTCIWNWNDEEGRIVYFEDIYNESQRQALLPSLKLAQNIFGVGNNFYAPYYRQISLDSWMEGEQAVAERFPYAMADVKNAFDYYMKHYNQGRPFVLAGFSQGAKSVVELLKELTAEEYERLVAAYVVGYRVTKEELANYPTIVGACGADDTGVTICYNSVATPDAICPVLSPSTLCINPVNWSRDEIPAVLNDTVTVTLDNTWKVLRVEGLDEEKYYNPSLGSLFKLGNYHLLELTLYKQSLADNVKLRIDSFRKKH